MTHFPGGNLTFLAATALVLGVNVACSEQNHPARTSASPPTAAATSRTRATDLHLVGFGDSIMEHGADADNAFLDLYAHGLERRTGRRVATTATRTAHKPLAPVRWLSRSRRAWPPTRPTSRAIWKQS
jgi:hypothetical protein